ncbi:MAG TPA: hypothetical protein VJ464_24530 [Blastocatellia bacterium]|nr:hypothetical protein [Blastocatellia bacterium]
MKRRVLASGLTLALALFAMSFKGCPSDSAADNDPRRKAAKAGDDIAGSVSAMIKLKRELAKQGQITKEEDLTLTNALLKLNSADKVFVTTLKSLKGTPDAASKTNLANLFGAVTSAISDLNTNGVLGVKNPDARTKLTNILNAINASAQIIAGFLQS